MSDTAWTLIAFVSGFLAGLFVGAGLALYSDDDELPRRGSGSLTTPSQGGGA